MASGLKAVLFDLDGVLCDTSEFHARAWADLVRSLGYDPPADLKEKVRGISRMASLKIALGENASKHTPDELEELAARKNQAYLEAVKHISAADLFPGVLELFEDLQAAGVNIVLGSASKNARPILEGLQIARWFDAVADGHSYKHGKPDPDVFVTGARMVGAEPFECIVVEDAEAGISAALDGGFVAVGMGTYDSLRHAHLYVGSLTELNMARLGRLHARYRSDRWTVAREGVHPEREGSLQTVFSLANGRIGVRGCLPQLPLSGPAGTYMAGFFDRLHRPPQEPEQWGPFMKYWGVPDLATDEQIEACIVNCPNFLDAEFSVDGEKVDFTTGDLRSLRRRLDMRCGVFTAEAHWVSPGGKELRLTQRRFADITRTERTFVQYAFEPLNFSGTLRIRVGIDGNTTNASEKGPQRLYDVLETAPVGDAAAAMKVCGREDRAEAAFAVGLKLPGRPGTSYAVESANDRIDVIAEAAAEQDRILYVEQVGGFALGRRDPDPLAAVKSAMVESLANPFGQARIAHTAQWQKLWEDSDVLIEGCEEDQVGIRFSIYHLLMAASPDDPCVSIGAKALTGEGYRGMVFWDTDIHMTPFYDFTQPKMARNLAMFRCRTLDGAREKAAKYGFRGASYPWETGVSGREECEKWLRLITHQSHITGDVAYALQQYVDATNDTEFYEDHAAEVLVETARFWLSKVVERDGALSIPDAGGPDEYHVVGDDSAYVNNLAIHNLRLADRVIRHLREKFPLKLDRLLGRTDLKEEEMASFSPVADRIRTMQRPDGLFEECRGFFGLKDEIERPYGGPEPFKTQCVKQADVLMLLYLLPDAWAPEVLEANWVYYEPRTIHASSLSHGVHGILAAELGMPDKADAYLRQSLGMDLHDEMNNAEHGAHMAANGMNWSAAVRGYGGARPQGDRFLVRPRLPARWTRLAFRLKWRGADFEVDARRDAVRVTNRDTASAMLPLRLAGREVDLPPGGVAWQLTR